MRCRPNQILHGVNPLVDVRRRCVQWLATREAEKPVSQSRCLLDRSQTDGNATIHVSVVPGHHLLLDYLQAVREDAEQVVEVVRDPTGELPHGFHLLTLAQLLSRRFEGCRRILFRGDVPATGIDHSTRRCGDPGNPAVTPVLVEAPRQVGGHAAAGRRLHECLFARRRMLRVVEVEKVASCHLARQPTENGRPGIVRPPDRAIRSNDGQQIA